MNIKVVHVMSDGTVRDSVKGLEIPITNKVAYQIIAKYSIERESKENKETA